MLDDSANRLCKDRRPLSHWNFKDPRIAPEWRCPGVAKWLDNSRHPANPADTRLKTLIDYIFVRRFASPAYWCVYTFTGLIAVAFLAAAFINPIALLFAAGFAIVTVLGAVSMIRSDTAGIKVAKDSLHWWCTGPTAVSHTVMLVDLCSVSYHHFDSEWIVLRFLDGTELRLDHRFFGNGYELLDAIHAISPALEVIDNGCVKYG